MNNEQRAQKGTALITGASSGIGFEFSKLFARDGHDLILVARRRERLQQLAKALSAQHGIKTLVISRDLAAPQTPAEIYAEVQASGMAVEYLVNNAGFGVYGPFAESDWQAVYDMMQVNMTALAHLTRLLLPDMLSRKSGSILNVASTGAFQAGPLFAVYYASKAFVLSFSEALAEELQGSDVKVTVLCPGPTATEFQMVAQVENLPLVKMGVAVKEARNVAEIAYKGMLAGKRLVIPGALNKVHLQGLRLLPRKLVTRLARMALKSF